MTNEKVEVHQGCGGTASASDTRRIGRWRSADVSEALDIKLTIAKRKNISSAARRLRNAQASIV
jgi:hypothetical protein